MKAVWILWLVVAVAALAQDTLDGGWIMRHTPYETRYFEMRGQAPGPKVMVIGGVHGDETAGYVAAWKLLLWHVQAGTLVVLPEAHREAIRRGVRAYPGNMNNMFPGNLAGSPMERLAAETFNLILKERPQLLVTLHESICWHAEDAGCYGQTLCYDFHALDPYMHDAMTAANRDIPAGRERFALMVEPHEHCPTYQTYMKLKIPTVSIETCRDMPLEKRVAYQLTMIRALCDKAGLGYEK